MAVRPTDRPSFKRNAQVSFAIERRYGSVGDAARCVRLSEKTIRRYITSGRLPAYRLGGAIRIDMDELEALMQPVTVRGQAHAAA